jgi:hypothetical protein
MAWVVGDAAPTIAERLAVSSPVKLVTEPVRAWFFEHGQGLPLWHVGRHPVARYRPHISIGLHLGEQLLVRENAGFGVGVSLELDSEGNRLALC